MFERVTPAAIFKMLDSRDSYGFADQSVHSWLASIRRHKEKLRRSRGPRDLRREAILNHSNVLAERFLGELRTAHAMNRDFHTLPTNLRHDESAAESSADVDPYYSYCGKTSRDFMKLKRQMAVEEEDSSRISMRGLSRERSRSVSTAEDELERPFEDFFNAMDLTLKRDSKNKASQGSSSSKNDSRSGGLRKRSMSGSWSSSCAQSSSKSEKAKRAKLL